MSTRAPLRLALSGLILLNLAILLFPNQAFAQATTEPTFVSELPDPVVVEETAEELGVLGCQSALPSRVRSSVYQEINMPVAEGLQHVEPSDAVRWSAMSGHSDARKSYWFCPTGLIESDSLQADYSVSGWQTGIIWIINNLLIISGVFLLWLLDWASAAMVAVLGMNTYMSHEVVQKGWPFIQGIANLGFILALLFIAAATTLRLNIGGVQRLLPRLLIAALLINFSLVIGALIIDMTRLLMAIEVNLIAGVDGNLADFGKKLVEKGGLSNGIALDADIGNYAWSIPANLAIKVMLIAALTMGMLYATVLLIIRHIALILLLLFSPLAYLALAIPKADNLAKKWWTEFLKWAFYGPILLFFLLLIVFVGATLAFDIENTSTRDIPTPLLESGINIGITTLMLIVAAKAGTSLAGAGGSAAVSMATKNGRRAAGWAWKNPKKAVAIAGTVASGGVGGAAVAGGGLLASKTKTAQDFSRNFTDNLGSRARNTAYVKKLMPSKRDKDGKLKPGQTSAGSYLGEKLSPSKSKEAADIKNIKPPDRSNPGNRVYNPENLLKGDVKAALDPRQISMLVTHGDSQQKQLMLSDVNIVNKMDASTKTGILSGGSADATQLLRTLREIDRRENSNK